MEKSRNVRYLLNVQTTIRLCQNRIMLRRGTEWRRFILNLTTQIYLFIFYHNLTTHLCNTLRKKTKITTGNSCCLQPNLYEFFFLIIITLFLLGHIKILNPNILCKTYCLYEHTLYYIIIRHIICIITITNLISPHKQHNSKPVTILLH